MINDREVAVTLSSSQMLQYYSVSPKLQAGRHIKLDGGGYCWSVAVTNDCIYISCQTHGILVLDTNGKPMRSITPSQTGINFQGVSYIALNRSGNKLYYSGCKSSQLICMTTDGNHIFTYKDPDLKFPRGLVVDDEDNVLITGENSNNIHVVKSDGTKHKALLTSSDDIQTPLGMAYNSTTKTLVVGGWGVEKLMIFNFQQS